MTSSMLSGDRRWASSRRSGMTVLGKVAVPKPINLPSQRLEKHGLYPNAKIVPKGTPGWGSRSSSSASNAWGSSLSPNTDGGTSSPSHLSGRPSSGGNGTHHSTAGSDRALVPSTSVWGSNSRPSSASGALPTTHSALASLRPHSAEARPGSSQLSRFAEPLIESSGAWNAARTTEKLGVAQLKNADFSLSSGDFPTLGTEKDKPSEVQDHISHSLHGSSFRLGREINETVGDDVSVNANIKGGTVNSWRRESQAHNDDGVRPSMEKWQGNSQPYPNAGFPPQHFDGWHGPPVNNPQSCVCFRGPRSGPPFGNSVPPSGFPIEPFPYYRPHMPPTTLANPPLVPPPGTGPGHHKNGDVFMPHMPEAYIRPGIPIRPGFYPGSVAYERYYSPPRGYCNSNERDAPFMGMTSGPPVHNRYSNQNRLEPGNSQGRSGGYSNAGEQLASQQVESSHSPDTSGPYRVLLEQHESDGKNEPTNWEDSESINASYVDAKDRPRMTVRENEQRSNNRKNEMDLRTSTHGQEVSSQTSENQVFSPSFMVRAKVPESSGIVKKSDEISARKLDGVASDLLIIPPRQSASKDASLVQKIEGLNAIARDNSPARIKEEQRNKFPNAPVNRVENKVGADVLPARIHATEVINPAYREIGVSGAEKNLEPPSFSGTATSRRIAHGMQGRGDHRNKGRFNNQDTDGWRKNSLVEDSSASAGALLEVSKVLAGDHCISVNQARHDGESAQTKSDPAESHAQRAKMIELAKQRTKQLQEEEEERSRKQKAKALAKLEELNRRAQAVDESSQKEDGTSSSSQNKQEEIQPSESATATGKFGVVSVNCDANTVSQINDTSANEVEKSTILSTEPPLESLKNSGKEPVLDHNQSMALHQDVNSTNATTSQVHSNIASKQKPMSYTQKQNLPSENTQNEKVVSTTSTAPKVEKETVVHVSLSSRIAANEVGSASGYSLPVNSPAAVESSVNLKKKDNRNNKDRQRVEETSSLDVPKEANRRWASSRRSGMTVLGKVAVPKPINLPSQRLENHGLDPNVEIVPKDALSLVSRSSSASNAWGSSLSPNTDGGTSSPSHLSGRPSSSGSGTRPSTAGSDRALEPSTNAWGSNSRPSSASGALPTTHSSLASLRPHSAETRPGSSQLSRFAEPLVENSGAWNAARTTEKLGDAQLKNVDFSLSSGDFFPTLGTEKDKPSEVQDDVSVNANLKEDTVNSWRRDSQAHNDDDVFMPHMPEAYIGPGFPIILGCYPGSVAYEGYYSPPTSYCNSNERDAPFMGMASGPPVHNGYSNQNRPEPGNFQGRSGGYSNAGEQLASQQVESSHPPDTSGPYRVLLEQHESDGKNEPTNWEDSESINASYVDAKDRPRMTAQENEQRSNNRKNEMDLRSSAHGEEVSSQTSENQVFSSSVIVRAKVPESSGILKKTDEISARKLDGVASDLLKIPPRQSASKDASLVQKIEGLNARARDNSSARIKEVQRNKFPTGNAPVNRVENKVGADVLPARIHATEVINPAHREIGVSGAENNLESPSFSGTATSRRIAHGMQGSGDHRNKGRLNNQDTDGWRKNSLAEDSSASSGALLEVSTFLVGDHCISVNQARHVGESAKTRSDPAESHAQRAKMVELAKQRTKQLQEEEEERSRKQKAKALAKLEELNRRAQAVDESSQKEDATSSSSKNKQEEIQPSESATAAGKSRVVSVNCDANTVSQINDTSANKVEKSPILSTEPPLVSLKNSGKEPVLDHNQSMTLHQDVNSANATTLQVHSNIASKQKPMTNKQKQNLPSEKMQNEKVVSTTSTAPKVEKETVVHVSLSSGIAANEVGSASGYSLPVNSPAAVESSVNLRKKNNRNNKNRQRVDETSSLDAPQSAIPKEANLSKSSVESGKSKAAEFELDQGLLQPAPLSTEAHQFSEQHRYLANEDSRARTNGQWKSQHSRKTPRNIQPNRPTEKSHGSDAVMWAPVKPQNKTEVMDESNVKSKIVAVNPVKSDQQVHNSKNKNAEIEKYISKPVAKEMAQQGSIQPEASSISQAHTYNSVERIDSGSQAPQSAQHTNFVFGRVGSGVESKNKDGRHTKQGKPHGSWRQRNQTGSTNVHDIQDGLDYDSNTEPNVQRPTEHHDDQKSEIKTVKGKTMHFNDSNDLDGSNNPETRDSATLVSVPIIKDHSTTAGRGRRVPFRGHKGVAGMNHDVDHKKNTGDTDKIETRFSSSDHGQQDVGAATKENRGGGERLMSQWQPKSQASNNYRGNRPNDQNVSSVVVGAGNKDSSTCDGESLQAGRGKSSNAHHDQSVSEKSKAGEAPHFGNQDAKREKKNAPPKRRPHSPNLVTGSSMEQAPTSTDLSHEQHPPSSGFSRNGNHNRFGRGHESRVDWKSHPQDNRRHNQPTNRERQGSNLQYEYHPVGPYDDGKLDNFDRPRDGSNGGGRFRERGGHTHSRRNGGKPSWTPGW